MPDGQFSEGQRTRGSSRFPFTSYPTGWFAVAFSRDLKPGDVKPIRNFGQNLVIFRTESGRAVVSDPYCPHLGAHLGFGGTVEGEAIRCPFHHWTFEANGGRCVAVPFAPPPPTAALRLWPTIERNDVILVWHDLAGRPPLWEMPAFEPTEDQSLADFAVFDGIRAHTQEILENGADWLHFYTVHATRRLQGRAGAFETEPHVLAYAYETREEAADPAGHDGNFQGEVWLYGPGCGRNLNGGEMSAGVQVENTVYPTPVDEDTIQIRAAYRVVPSKDGTLPPEALHGMFAVVGPEIKRQLEQDFQIWANKAYLTQPLLAASDGPILAYRKWYSQFYPDGSPARLERGA
jgi:phenylpropionate dioxygenase-like ring-hydroxylating dioxygenase large terminal subunit